MVMASCDAQIHVLNLMAATWFSQQAFERLFKEAELASSTEYATCAAHAESMEMTASQPLKNLRHEAFAQRIAAGASATAAYAHAYGRERDNVAAVKGGQLIRKVNIRERAMALEAENALASLPTAALIMKGLERQTIRQIENAQMWRQGRTSHGHLPPELHVAVQQVRYAGDQFSVRCG
jgi:hypothetical protein